MSEADCIAKGDRKECTSRCPCASPIRCLVKEHMVTNITVLTSRLGHSGPSAIWACNRRSGRHTPLEALDRHCLPAQQCACLAPAIGRLAACGHSLASGAPVCSGWGHSTVDVCFLVQMPDRVVSTARCAP